MSEPNPLVAYDDDGSNERHQPYLAFNQGHEARWRGYGRELNPYEAKAWSAQEIMGAFVDAVFDWDAGKPFAEQVVKVQVDEVRFDALMRRASWWDQGWDCADDELRGGGGDDPRDPDRPDPAPDRPAELGRPAAIFSAAPRSRKASPDARSAYRDGGPAQARER